MSFEFDFDSGDYKDFVRDKIQESRNYWLEQIGGRTDREKVASNLTLAEIQAYGPDKVAAEYLSVIEEVVEFEMLVAEAIEEEDDTGEDQVEVEEEGESEDEEETEDETDQVEDSEAEAKVREALDEIEGKGPLPSTLIEEGANIPEVKDSVKTYTELQQKYEDANYFEWDGLIELEEENKDRQTLLNWLEEQKRESDKEASEDDIMDIGS